MSDGLVPQQDTNSNANLNQQNGDFSIGSGQVVQSSSQVPTAVRAQTTTSSGVAVNASPSSMPTQTVGALALVQPFLAQNILQQQLQQNNTQSVIQNLLNPQTPGQPNLTTQNSTPQPQSKNGTQQQNVQSVQVPLPNQQPGVIPNIVNMQQPQAVGVQPNNPQFAVLQNLIALSAAQQPQAQQPQSQPLQQQQQQQPQQSQSQNQGTTVAIQPSNTSRVNPGNAQQVIQPNINTAQFGAVPAFQAIPVIALAQPGAVAVQPGQSNMFQQLFRIDTPTATQATGIFLNPQNQQFLGFNASILPNAGMLTAQPQLVANANQLSMQNLLAQMAAANNPSMVVPPIQQKPGVAAMQTASQSSVTPNQSKRLPMPIFMDYDEETLTEYQCLLRKQIELFEADPGDIKASAQGRNNPILLGQVGIRCRHCNVLPLKCRPRGAVYYSRTIDGLYQVAQNMSKLHFCKTCTQIPADTRARLSTLQKVNRRAAGGKEYWSEGLRVLGVYEDGNVMRFRNSLVGRGDSSDAPKEAT